MTHDSDAALSAKREVALSEIFGSPRGLKRNAKAAAALAVEALDALIAALDAGHALGEDYGDARRQVDLAVWSCSVNLGRACVDGMQGMVHDGVVDEQTPMPREADGAFGPLVDAWQRGGAPYHDASVIASQQRSTLLGLSAQPNQLFRRLAESVALGADLACWASWVNEMPPRLSGLSEP